MELTRYRTINGCTEEIKAIDPRSAISTYFIRCLCASGKVQFINAGNRVYVNLDSLIEFLRQGN